MRLMIVLAASLALLACGSDTPKCKKGKPCGETCIDKDKDCHK